MTKLTRTLQSRRTPTQQTLRISTGDGLGEASASLAKASATDRKLTALGAAANSRFGRAKSPEPHLTVRDVADLYRVTPRCIRNWIAAGALRAVRVGRVIRIPQSALLEFDRRR